MTVCVGSGRTVDQVRKIARVGGGIVEKGLRAVDNTGDRVLAHDVAPALTGMGRIHVSGGAGDDTV